VTAERPDPGDLRGFDAAARRAVARADAEARELGHDHVGTEHLLLGLLTSQSVTARVLANAGVTLTAARHKVSEAVGAPSGGPEPGPGALPRTPRVERALGRSVRFAHARGSDLVGSQHVLLGVLDVEGTAGQVLRGLGLDVDRLRMTLDRLPATPDATAAAEAAADGDPATDPVPATRADPPPGRRRATPPASDELAAAEDVAPATLGGPLDDGPPAPAPVTCPGCDADLTDGLGFRVVKARSDQGRTRDVLLFSCRACGRALGAR
jgi:hypothetical protein